MSKRPYSSIYPKARIKNALFVVFSLFFCKIEAWRMKGEKDE